MKLWYADVISSRNLPSQANKAIKILVITYNLFGDTIHLYNRGRILDIKIIKSISLERHICHLSDFHRYK